MRRRTIWSAAVLAALLVLPATPASAAQSTLITPDGDVTGPTAIELELERDFGAERLNEVYASLREDGARIGRRVQLECVEHCEATDRVVRFSLPDDQRFDPDTGAPFNVDAPMANGTYVLYIELKKNSQFQNDEEFEHELHLAVEPTAPADVIATVEGAEVELTWTPSPEPDVDTYRVERHDGDEDWEEVASTSRARAVDEPGAGEHRYRVVAERSDGREGILEAVSEEVEVEVEEGDEDADGNGDDGDGEDADGEDADPERDDENGEASDDGDTSSSESRNRSGPTARAPQTGGGGSGDVPDLADRDDGEVGETEDGYEEELDYGDFEVGRDEDVQVATPSGWRGTVDRIFDAERVAVPIATGLIMTATGLHLWRWMRVPV